MFVTPFVWYAELETKNCGAEILFSICRNIVVKED